MERLIKCNHPQFGNNNKEKLQSVFTFILQYINDCADDIEDSDEAKEKIDTIDELTPFLYDLGKFSPQPSGQAMRSVINEKYEEFCKAPKNSPSIATVILNSFSRLHYIRYETNFLIFHW